MLLGRSDGYRILIGRYLVADAERPLNFSERVLTTRVTRRLTLAITSISEKTAQVGDSLGR